MRKINGLSAAIVAAAMLVGTSAFADSRPQNETWRDQNRGDDRDRGGYRDHDRVTLEGRITSLDRERDGYRVRLDHSNYSFFVPERQVRNRRRDFRVGLSIRLGGVFRAGSIFVDAVDYPGTNYSDGYYRGRYNDGFIRGLVDRIDYRRDVLVLRDERTGRFVEVDMRGTDRRRRSIDADDLRRGDFVSLSGQWIRGTFVADRVESVRSGGRRY
jgi:hypothetical protein